jgi:hypothetical protein
MTFNAISSVVDTVTARIGETKPKPYFLTSGGSYRAQRKAKKLNQFIEGSFYETKAYDVGLDAFRDAAVWGDGFIHVFARNGKLCKERVLESELWVDEEEAKYGFPRTLYRHKSVDREELAGFFPEARKLIMSANRDARGTLTQNLSDMLVVIEAWHLGHLNANGELVGGRHNISIAEGTLFEDDWKHDRFPFAKMPWRRRPIGYWSQGICEARQGEQLELNKELWLIQRSMHLAGSIKVFLKVGSKVVKEHINNDVGAIISYTGEPPQFFCPEPIHQVYFTNVNNIIDRIFKAEGISELTAAGRKPAGLNAAVAIREVEDIESDRFRSISRQNDNLYLDMAELDIMVAREIAKDGKGPIVRVPGKRSFSELDFKKDLKEVEGEQYVRQCFPVSRLPRDPSGRLQTITEYIQAGFMTPRQGRRALDFPDLDTIESLANAQEDLLTEVLDKMVDDGEYTPPEPTDDLQLGKELVVEYIQRFRTLDLEPERMEMLRTWSSQLDAMVARMNAPPPGMAPGAGPTPGTPQAPPVPMQPSPMVPNVPQTA